MSLCNLTALELGQKIKSREVSVIEATKFSLDQIEKYNPTYNCYISVCSNDALRQAEIVQKQIDEKVLTSPLAGVPIGIKDNICTKDIKTTCASKMLSDFKPFYNATVVTKLKNSGSIILGKLNMDEFAMGGTSKTSFYGSIKNPWDITCVSGGSSGGSAVAVAANLAFATLGSDTGGSIRQPASYCGVTGLKPTYGSVSRYGLVAHASSLDQIGPIGKDVSDVFEVFKTIMGYDPLDNTSVDCPYTSSGIKGLRIGIPLEYFSDLLDLEVHNSFMSAVKTLESLGANIETFSMPELKHSTPVYYIISCAEASSNLSRYDGIKYGYKTDQYKDLTDLYFKTRNEGFGDEVKSRILMGTFVLNCGYSDQYYNKALQVKQLIKNSFNNAFLKYDIIISPAAVTTATKFSDNTINPLISDLSDIYTTSVNLAGLPAISIPCGFDKNGLPIGLQMIANSFCENTLQKASLLFQNATDYHTKKPTLIKEV